MINYKESGRGTVVAIVLVIAVVLVILIVRSVLKSQDDSETTLGGADVVETASLSEDQSLEVVSDLPLDSPETAKEEDLDAYQRELNFEQEALEWKHRFGHFTRDELGLYAGYSVSVLQSLADNGDLMAIEILRDSSENYRDVFFERIMMGAAAGSTAALTTWHVQFHNDVVEANNAGDLEGVRQLFLHRLADYEIAMRRGDLRAWELGMEHLGEYFERFEADPITSEELAWVSAVADDKQAAIEDYRQSKLWPELENEIDPSVFTDEYREKIGGMLSEIKPSDAGQPVVAWGEQYLTVLFDQE